MPLTDSFPNLLIRGLLAGLIAGVITGGVAFALGERHIDAAIAIEEAAAPPVDETQPHAHEEALVSRDGQRLGLILAMSLAGLAIGAIFSVAVHYARRATPLRAPVLVLLMAGLGWLAIALVPFLKYPANPPAVGNPDTIDQRTILWVGAVALGLLAVLVGLAAARATARQSFLSVRVAAPILAFLVVVVVGYQVLPVIDEVGEGFPASLLWEFRISSMVTQATLWLTLGVGFTWLTERAAARVPVPQPALEASPA